MTAPQSLISVEFVIADLTLRGWIGISSNTMQYSRIYHNERQQCVLYRPKEKLFHVTGFKLLQPNVPLYWHEVPLQDITPNLLISFYLRLKEYDEY